MGFKKILLGSITVDTWYQILQTTQWLKTRGLVEQNRNKTWSSNMVTGTKPGHQIRGKTEPATSYQQPDTNQIPTSNSGTGSGYVITGCW